LPSILLVALFVLGVSFLSNVSPFFGASYTLLATLQLTLLGFSLFNFLLVVIVSAVGATLAKVMIYYGAFGLKRFLVGNKNIRLIGKNSTTRKFYFVLFVTALLPILPLDDFIYIGAGATASRIGAMTLVTLAAKVAKSGFEVAIEFAILKDIAEAFGFNRLDLTAALTGAFLIIGILIYKLDWQATYRKIWPRRTGPSTAGHAVQTG
jgi:hypothetical protein